MLQSELTHQFGSLATSGNATANICLQRFSEQSSQSHKFSNEGETRPHTEGTRSKY